MHKPVLLLQGRGREEWGKEREGGREEREVEGGVGGREGGWRSGREEWEREGGGRSGREGGRWREFRQREEWEGGKWREEWE